MICSGASELAMAQWASAYAEAALGLSKTVGDLAGPCMFAVTMGISRIIFGKYGDKMDLMKFMIGSGILCVICYLLVSVSLNPISGLIGCIICGFSVGIMWPGTISISSERFSGRWNGYVCFACYGGGPGWKHRSGDCWTCYTKCRRQYSCRYGSWAIVPGYFINRAFYFCKAKNNNESFFIIHYIEVISQKTAQRVMDSITKYIESKLLLKVNRKKSKIGRPIEIKYLGFTFYNQFKAKKYKAKAHEKSVQKGSKKME